MAINLLIPDKEKDLIALLERRAARNGRSAEEEHLDILRQALRSEEPPGFLQAAAKLRELTKDRRHTPAEILQREGRDER
ncbi:MAG TPA: hypothetical protein DCL54_05915 [Alphaproteobacteria bacterium]|nr:hypothetical protein [Alphaproteobacteria bacterium]HAJ46099.1 hypothetical protein [Alphaproteobacteria bacterium]